MRDHISMLNRIVESRRDIMLEFIIPCVDTVLQPVPQGGTKLIVHPDWPCNSLAKSNRLQRAGGSCIRTNCPTRDLCYLVG
jgi:hypothetical protein